MITICSVVYNNESTGLFDLLVESVNKYTNFVPQFLICDNGLNGNTLNKYKDLPNFVIKKGPTTNSGSLQHGESLNFIINFVKTEKVALVESDCVILNKNWEQLSEGKIALAEKQSQNGKKYYHVCFLVALTDIVKKIDFRPGTDKNRSNRNYKFWEDVGWRLSDCLDSKDVKTLRFIDCKTGQGQIFDSSFQSDELWQEGAPIIGHFGRGANLKGKAVRKGFAPAGTQLTKWKQTIQIRLRSP